MQSNIGEKDTRIEELEKALHQMQQGKKDSDLSIDNKINSSKSINSNSISSIEINTSKIYEVIEDENINENTIIDDDLVINSPTREKKIKVTLIPLDLSTEW